jgi:hypothetical protein
MAGSLREWDGPAHRRHVRPALAVSNADSPRFGLICSPKRRKRSINSPGIFGSTFT